MQYPCLSVHVALCFVSKTIAVAYTDGIKLAITTLVCLRVCVHVHQTTNASAFLLHEVAKSPTIQNRLHAELVSVLGDIRKQVTAEDIPKLIFAKNCIREILRYAVHVRSASELGLILYFTTDAQYQVQ